MKFILFQGQNQEHSDSEMTRFKDFLQRAQRYTSVLAKTTQGRLIVVEDIPNTLYYHLEEFHALMRKFSQQTKHALVFIGSTSSADGTRFYKLLRKEAVGMLIQEIKFNPVAITSLVKALTKISDVEGRKSRGKQLSKEKIREIAEHSAGDIRCAINSLQFSTRQQNHVPNSIQSNQSANKKKVSTTTNKLSQSYGRDNSLVIFHALGKFLNPKRQVSLGSQDEAERCKLPPWAAKHFRMPFVNHMDPEAIIDQSHLLPTMFSSYLHENYLSFFSDLDDVVDASEWFSVADAISDLSLDKKVMKYPALITSQGLLHANNHPSQGKWRPLHKPKHMGVRNSAKQHMLSCQEIIHQEIAIESKHAHPSCKFQRIFANALFFKQYFRHHDGECSNIGNITIYGMHSKS
eukprot:m.102131 g.102131  ORF g.102131 m.102131 type:complete len:405 (-) comp13761_c0_seq5:417-1631(-)